MPVPGHREDCATRLFATRCHDCGRKVWYFDCTCGSKVYFDLPGPPWPRHLESCPIYHLRNLINQGVPPDTIKKLIRDRAEHTGKAFDFDIIEMLNRYGASGKKHVIDIPPSTTPTEITGDLKEINEVNIYKRLKLQRNPIIEKVLGDFGYKNYHELVIREQDYADPDQLNQWFILIPSEELVGCFPKVGMKVFGIIEGVEIYEDEMVWIAEEIDWK